MATTYMALSLPVVSTTTGPTWASMLNAALTVVDLHDHSTGYGRPVRTAGLSIDADLSLGGFNLTSIRSLRLTNGSVLALGTDIGCLFESGGDLYFNNSTGQHVKITSGAALNASAVGGIGGDYTTTTASVVYVSASQTFQFFQATNQYANLDVGNVILREPGVTSPHGITLKSPSGLTADYSLTMLTALPGSTLPLSVSSAGALSAAQIATAQIADAAVTAAKTDAVSAATASMLMVRDASGRAQVADPSADADIDTLGARNTAISTGIAWTSNDAGLTAGTGWTLDTVKLRRRWVGNGIAMVFLSLSATAGATAGTTIATIPVGYRYGGTPLAMCAAMNNTAGVAIAAYVGVDSVMLKSASLVIDTNVYNLTVMYLAEG